MVELPFLAKVLNHVIIIDNEGELCTNVAYDAIVVVENLKNLVAEIMVGDGFL